LLDFEGLPPVPVPARVRAVDAPFAAPAAESDAAGSGALVLVPSRVDLGACAPGEILPASTWVVNRGPEPVRILGGAPRRVGARMNEPVHVLVEGREPVRFGLDLFTEDTRIVRVRRYLEARERDEPLEPFFAPDSRAWHGERDGPGEPRAPDGGGPWAEWDAELGAVTRAEDLALARDGAVEVVVTETNDYYRLLERAPARYRMSFWLDAHGRITGTLVRPLEGHEPDPGAKDEFLAWARGEREGEIEALYPIRPSRENAQRMRALILEWRRATGRE
jgi:hypothetical protein